MNVFEALFTIFAAVLLLIFVFFSALLLQILRGKSIGDPNYPPVVGTVFNQLFYFNTLYDYQVGMGKKHKTSRLLAPDQSEIYTTEPRNIEHILKTNFNKYGKGKYNLDILGDLFGQGILLVDGDKWRHQRKLASVEFSTRVLRDFSCGVFRKNSGKLVRVIYELSRQNRDFDIQIMLMRCTLDSIFKVGFGVELNCFEGSNREGNEFIKAFDDSNELVYWRYVDPLWKIKRYLDIGAEASLKNNIKIIHDFVDKVIKTKRRQMETQEIKNDKEDILSRFLIESKKDPETMNNEYLRDVILNYMIAGKDSTANTLSWFIYLLCKNPLIQEKIAQEIEQVVGSPLTRSTENFVECITDEALENMHYLHAALTETLRLYPAVPVDGRAAEIDDTLPDGYKVKKGDGIYYLAYAMGRMTYIWGDDAEEFRPERWIKNGVFQPESPFKFVAFHAGPRTCLGKDFAYRQMKIVSASLVHFFRFKLSDDTKNVTYRTMITLHISGSLNIRAFPRKELTELIKPNTKEKNFGPGFEPRCAPLTIFVTILLLIIVLVSALLLQIIRGKSIRDPNYAPVVGTVFHQLFYFNRLYDYQIWWAKKYKTCRLLAPDQSEIYTVEPKNVEHILKTNFNKYGKGEYNQDILRDLLGQGIFMVDGDQWLHQRKLASVEFSTRVLRDFSCSVFRKNSGKLVRAIYEFSRHNQDFDIQIMLMRCTLDSIFKVGFGVELNCLEGSNREGNEFIKAFDDSNELVYWRFADPLWKLKRYLDIGAEASLKKNIKIIHEFVDKVIKTKRRQMEMQEFKNDKEDVLSRFLLESEKDPETMNDEYLRDIILNYMIAGKDTTANTLSWFIYVLCKNPVVQEKIAQEIEQAVGSPLTRSIEDFVGSITEEALENMHYLHAALTETLRLYPAVPVDGRSAEADDTLPDGFKVKKGDGIYYMAYVMGRMTHIWGDDAEEFRPERWIKNGVFQPESPFKFVAFHAGPRTCLGKDFAYRQMKIVSASLFHFFRFKLSDDTKNVTYRTMLTLHISGSLNIRAYPRKELIEL